LHPGPGTFSGGSLYPWAAARNLAGLGKPSPADRGDEQGIWLLDLEGGEPHRLCSWKNLSPTGLTWSPQGDRLAFLGVSTPPKPEGEHKTGDGGLKLRRITRPLYRFDGSGWLVNEGSSMLWRMVISPDTGEVTAEALTHPSITGPVDDIQIADFGLSLIQINPKQFAMISQHVLPSF